MEGGHQPVSTAADTDEPWQWQSHSFMLEMKPRTEFASLFVGCPKLGSPTIARSQVEPTGILRLEEHLMELCIDCHSPKQQKKSILLSSSTSSSSSEDILSEDLKEKGTTKLSTKFSDILLAPATVSSLSWADTQQELLMCKIKAEADCVSFSPKTMKKLEEELVQGCHLQEYVDAIEHSGSQSFRVDCAQCGRNFHNHSKNDFGFGLLPSDDWLDSSPQLDYFCALSGSACCAGHLPSVSASSSSSPHNLRHIEGGLLGISTSTDSMRTWLPGERKIVLSDSFILLMKCELLEKGTICTEFGVGASGGHIVTCLDCEAQLGTILKNHPDVYRLHLSVLNVYGKNQQRNGYIASRFHSMECYLAWMLLNKCEQHSSMKLLVRSLDKSPQLLVWLLEPYVLLTKGVLQQDNQKQKEGISSKNNPNDTAAISFPALKVLYKLFDSDTAKQDPRANGADSSVGILEVPLGCCHQLIEHLLTSSLTLPPQLRALGQFYVGFIRLKDRVD